MADNIENIDDIEDITDDQTLAEIDLFWGMFKDSEEMSFTFFKGISTKNLLFLVCNLHR